MRLRGAVRGWKTLSRFALIGVIGGGAAACSTDASRLSDPFTNPFSLITGEPAATGSLGAGEEGGQTVAPAIRTPRIQSQELAAPGTAMTPRAPSAAAMAAPAAGAVSGMNPSSQNPDAGRAAKGPAPNAQAMTPRVTPAAPQPKLQFSQGAKSADKKADKAAEANAKKAEEAKASEAKRAAEAKKIAETKKVADAKHAAEKAAEAKKTADKAAQKAAEARKVAEAKPASKADAKKVEAAKKADAEAKAARAEASKEAARKVAEAKAAEAAAKASAKETKVAAKDAPVPAKPAAPEPANTGSVAQALDPSESFRWPAKGRVINAYGSSGNEGINIAVPEGTPVKAAEDGTVAYAGSDVKGYGKLVLVRHSNGFVSAYAHNGELDVRPGEKVKRGQTIAKSGATGNVTSPQLHFEIRKGATPVDPIPHLASN